jgi:hypothetical protein
LLVAVGPGYAAAAQELRSAIEASMTVSNYADLFPAMLLEEIALAASAANYVKIMDSVGTDMQLISPRRFQLNHSAKPAKVVHLWVRAINDTIARSVICIRLVSAGWPGCLKSRAKELRPVSRKSIIASTSSAASKAAKCKRGKQ